jgi:NAD(P)-dependent dehydrogenase (short-subunit alcohol dehydrogenase family)
LQDETTRLCRGYRGFNLQPLIKETNMRLAKKIALVTGGSSGIGFASARLFLAEGARVAITGRDQQRLDAAARELGGDVLAVRADAGDPRAGESAVAKVVERFGGLDVVFANAGIVATTPLGDTSIEAFEEILRVNVTGVFFTVQAAAAHLREGGSVILNGSVHAVMGQPGRAAYAASKAAVRSLARSLASELAPRRIRANVVVPGATRTPIWGEAAPSAEAMQALEARLGRIIPLGRMVEAEEIARAVLFLASDESSMITGSELVVDGGATQAPSGAAIYR